MALQSDGITVRQVNAMFGRIILLIGAIEIRMYWNRDKRTFIQTSSTWIDGRRNAGPPRLTKDEWRRVNRQAYGIAHSRGW